MIFMREVHCNLQILSEYELNVKLKDTCWHYSYVIQSEAKNLENIHFMYTDPSRCSG